MNQSIQRDSGGDAGLHVCGVDDGQGIPLGRQAGSAT